MHAALEEKAIWGLHSICVNPPRSQDSSYYLHPKRSEPHWQMSGGESPNADQTPPVFSQEQQAWLDQFLTARMGRNATSTTTTDGPTPTRTPGNVGKYGEGKKTCTCRELESLIGTLHRACKVIPAGRSFMRRAIELLSIARRRHHHIRLNKEIRSDLAWWKVFTSNWNGASLVTHSNSEQIHVTSDASGSWGCGRGMGPSGSNCPGTYLQFRMRCALQRRS